MRKTLGLILVSLFTVPALAHFEIEARQTSCKRATAQEIARVNEGNKKLKAFVKACVKKTGSEEWCNQLTRPNPESYDIFKCTYGANQPHMLIHPDETTWGFAFEAVKLVQELEARNVGVCLVYNWWRPEPYNQNVGGAAARHPFGTSIDVAFCTKAEQQKAHAVLCELRSHGRLRALGEYPGTGLHLGVGDTRDNTWGKPCPL
ncbi:MAG TPA: hypothetical protein VM432_03970 [Bdellovibrionales bacterium]|jgi:hypothetical protein|nr:hypothetical protein [Bdellovibrionales bacterium]